MRNFIKVLATPALLLAAAWAHAAPPLDAPLTGPSPSGLFSLPAAGQAVAPAPGLSISPLSSGSFSPRLTTGELARRPNVQLHSRSVLVVRADNGEVLYRKNIDRDLSIASITKLMTAMITLDAGQPFDEVISISKADIDTLKGTHSRLSVGTRLTRGELLLLALMSSENRAASALARNYPGGLHAAIDAMNRKAIEIGMTHARFVDGTGLSSSNKASAIDLVRLVKAAQSYETIRRYSTTTQHAVSVGRQKQLFRNTNPLVKNPDWAIDVTKTGFINEAGRCLVMQARIGETPVIMVLMDSQGKLSRVGDANRVRQWLESTLNLGSLVQDGPEGGA